MMAPNGEGALETFDPLREDVLAHPFDWYAWLRRRERAYRVEAHDFYAVGRYDDVVTVTKEHGTFSSTGGVGMSWTAQPMMSMYDPPDHTRLRRIVASAFTPKTVAALRPAMVAETTALFDRCAGRETFDFVTDFAEPLVARVIADLVGLSPELVPSFRRWSLSVTAILAGNMDPAAGEADRRELVQAMRDAKSRNQGLIRVLSDASADERLTDRELTAFCVLMLIAGFETTVNGLANVAATLMDHDETFQAVRRREVEPSTCIEEALRFDPPVHAFFRNTLKPWTFPDGSTIPTGKKVMVLFASANHDGDRFSAPETFDVRRSSAGHVAFGSGVHYCIGAALARTLYDVVVAALVARPGRLVPKGRARRTRNSMLRGFESLPVALGG